MAAEIAWIKFVDEAGNEITMPPGEADDKKKKWGKKLAWILWGFSGLVGLIVGLGGGGGGFRVNSIKIVPLASNEKTKM